MSRTPDVSVVMGVYNGESALPKTIDSVLAQQDVDFEFIIINDGSVDGSKRVLENYAEADTRIRLFHQNNKGLTQALIEGCRCASGQFIARQDVHDESLPGRLAKQLKLLRSNPALSLVACNYEVVGPGGEFMYAKDEYDPEQTRDRLWLKTGDPGGIHHGTAMFSKSAYVKAGGYRKEFYVAQDVDLWTRLIETGGFDVVPDIVYRATYTLDGISSEFSRAQIAARNSIVELTTKRRAGESENELLLQLEISQKERYKDQKTTRQCAAYYIGGCLLQQKDARAKKYLNIAKPAYKLKPKFWLKYFKAQLQ